MKNNLTILQRIYLYLQTGGKLTHLSAFELFHCQCLTKRMSELRQLGVAFDSYQPHSNISVYYIHKGWAKVNDKEFDIDDIKAPSRCITLLDVVRRTDPNVDYMNNGCPSDRKFSTMFKNKNYKQPTEIGCPHGANCMIMSCSECWRRPAEKL